MDINIILNFLFDNVYFLMMDLRITKLKMMQINGINNIGYEIIIKDQFIAKNMINSKSSKLPSRPMIKRDNENRKTNHAKYLKRFIFLLYFELFINLLKSL